MADRLIQRVINNEDKKKTYAENMKRYERAMAGEFYYEAMLIDYAMLEDRMRSFLYHIGLFKTRDSYTADNGQFAAKIRMIVDEYKGPKETKALNVNSIAGKMKIIRCTLLWASMTEGTDDPILKMLKRQYEGVLDIGAFLDLLDEISVWCKYRNEVIHSLLNKNLESLHQQLPERAEYGIKLARMMDEQVKRIKKGHLIRRKMNLKTE